jgi:uncharacterized protein
MFSATVKNMSGVKQCFRRGFLAIATVLAMTAGISTGRIARAEGDTTNAAGAASSPEGLYRQGVQLVYASNIVTEETLRGVALLEAAAAQGNVDALLQLGSLNLYGTILPQNWGKALVHYQAAARAGNWSGIAEYGAMLMWTERDWRAGQELMTDAAGRGATFAWVTLAEGATYGYLGGGRHSRAKYAAFAEKAKAAGEPRIAVVEAARYQWGVSVKADGTKAVEVLQAAADTGNAVAAWALINLLRDGNGQNVRRSTQAAQAAQSAYADLFTAAQNWQLERALQAALARSPADMAALADEVMARRDLVTRDFGPLLVSANLNAAIYVLQVKLAAAGADIGRPDGFARTRTLAAMYDACMKAAPPALCNDSVMRSDVMAALFTMQ